MKKKNTRISKAVMKWQTGEYRKNQTFTFELPTQFLMLCKLADVTPEQVLLDFMDNLSFSAWRREGRGKARAALSDYFIEAGYGKELFSQEEMRLMFCEMDSMAMLFPRDAGEEVVDAYAHWRRHHQGYWFDKWRKKRVPIERKPPVAGTK